MKKVIDTYFARSAIFSLNIKWNIVQIVKYVLMELIIIVIFLRNALAKAMFVISMQQFHFSY